MTYIVWAWMAAAAHSWLPFPDYPFNSMDDCQNAIHAMSVAHPDVKLQCLPEGEEPK